MIAAYADRKPPAACWLATLLLAFAAAIGCVTAHAQILECIDGKGHKEYANVCPPGTTEARKMMKSGVGTPSGSAATAGKPSVPPKSTAEQEAEFRKRQIERQEGEAKAEKQKAEADNRRQQCDQAQAQLRALENGQRMTRLDPKTGERAFIDDADRPGEIEQARKAVQTWCK